MLSTSRVPKGGEAADVKLGATSKLAYKNETFFFRALSRSECFERIV